MSLSIERRFEIDAGHRVLNHESVCAHPHGHRYAIVVSARAKDGLDSLGRVIDFGVIKDILGAWLLENWDHAFLTCAADEVMITFLESNAFRRYILPENPTADNLATHLLDEVCPRLFAQERVEIMQVRVHETPNCVATAAR